MIAFLVFSFVFVNAGEEYSKKISRNFTVKSDAELVVLNKYGKVYCKNWDKNEVAIEVTITVEASSEDKANKYFDKIGIDITGNPTLVRAETSIESGAFSKGNTELSIDYMIQLPKSMSIDIDNKFGDIYIEEVDGEARIDLGYGAIKAKKLNNNNNSLEIKFSEGNIGFVYKAEMELKYSELTLDEANDLNVDTRFSELDFGLVDRLVMDSGYDENNLGDIRDMEIESSFSEIEIASLAERLVAQSGYGDITVREIKKGFALIDIDNDFADTKLWFDGGASFTVDVDTKMGDFYYPKAESKISSQELSFTSHKFSGTIGSGTNPVSKVKVVAKNADVKIDFK